jgi:hypothetical protein
MTDRTQVGIVGAGPLARHQRGHVLAPTPHRRPWPPLAARALADRRRHPRLNVSLERDRLAFASAKSCRTAAVISTLIQSLRRQKGYVGALARIVTH